MSMLLSILGTILVTSGFGWSLIGFMNLVVKNSNLKKQEQQRQEKEQELAEASKKD